RYAKEGGAYPDPILNLTWRYAIAESPTPDELAREINGYAVAPIQGANGQAIAAGRQVDGFADLKDDGSTACACWVYSGCYT
ncbi:hypothetical protein P0P54_09485, partial [Campylobacter jejuni]|uniref:hypothetical protein n=1 Tax=Campylobacter jejuni TaxID=197 RepID=UPI002FBE75B6